MANDDETWIPSRRYEISEEETALTAGQGRIFRAIDRRFNRPVLIKVLKPKYASLETSQLRFAREAEISASLQHPGIVPVHDFFTNEDDVDCCVMEYVYDEGIEEPTRAPTLGDLLDTHKSNTRTGFDADSVSHLLRLLSRAAGTVSYAHRRKCIHRDLKCDNILVTASRVLVIDWGAAKILNQEDVPSEERIETSADESELVTLTNDRLGTPPYAAPELAVDPSSANEKSDVYSLGIILYRVLTGQLPPRAAPSVPNPRELKPSIPKSLAAICVKATEPSPRERYASADAFQSDLDRWLDDQPVSVRQEDVSEKFWRFTRRHRTRASVGLTLGVALLGGLFVVNRVNATKNKALKANNDALVQAVDENETLSGELSDQLVRIKNRQYSSALREAGDLLENQDPDSARSLLDDTDLCPPELHEFTWRLLRKAVDKVHRFEPTHRPPRHLVFEGRGKDRSLVLAFPDGRVDVWRGPNFEERETKFSMQAPISSLALWRSGRHTKVAVGTRAGVIAVGDWTGEVIFKVKPGDAVVNLVGFHHDTGDLVTGDMNGNVRVWELGREVPKAEYQITGEVLGYGYSSVAHALTAGRRGGNVHTLDLNSARAMDRPNIRAWAGAIRYYRNGSRVAISQRSGDVHFFETQNDEWRYLGFEHQFDSPIRHFRAFRVGDYDQIAAANKEDGVHISQPGRKGWMPLKVRKKRYHATSLCFSNDGDLLAFGHADSHISFWNIQPLSPSPLNRIEQEEDASEITCFAWASDSKSVQWGTLHGGLYEAGSPTSKVILGNPIRRLDRDSRSGKTALVFESGEVQVFDGETMLAKKKYSTPFRDPIRDVSFISDDRITVLSNEQLEILDSASLELLVSIGLSDMDVVNGLHRAACSSDLAVINAKYELFCFELSSKDRLWKVQFPNKRKVEHLAIFPDGQHFITCDRTGEVRLWSTDTGDEIRILKMQAGPIMGIDISPDGRTVAVVDRSGRLTLMDSMLGHTRLTLYVPVSRMVGLSFSPDGTSLAAATRAGVYLWSTE